MRNLLFAIVLLACSIHSFAEDSEKGRFQLVQGTLPSAIDGASGPAAIFKIDTVTGAVWHCVRFDTKDSTMYVWLPISETPTTQMKTSPSR